MWSTRVATRPSRHVRNRTHVDGYLSALPDAAREIVERQLLEVTRADDDTLSGAALIALAIAIYSSSKGTANLISGLNVAYQEAEERKFFALRLCIMALTLLALNTGLFALGALAALPLWMQTIFQAECVTDTS